MKTLLEVIKINKTNIDKIKVGTDFMSCNIGDEVIVNGKNCLCAGKVNGKNMFIVIGHKNLKSQFMLAQSKTKLYYDKLPFNKSGIELTKYVLDNYKQELNRTIWKNLDNDEFIPSSGELKNIFLNLASIKDKEMEFWDILELDDEDIWSASVCTIPSNAEYCYSLNAGIYSDDKTHYKKTFVCVDYQL